MPPRKLEIFCVPYFPRRRAWWTVAFPGSLPHSFCGFFYVSDSLWFFVCGLTKLSLPLPFSYLESNSLSCLHQCFSSCFQPYSSLFISDPLIHSHIASPLYRFTAVAVLLSSVFCTPGLLHNFHKYPGSTFRTITRTVSSEQELSGLVFSFSVCFLCFRALH